MKRISIKEIALLLLPALILLGASFWWQKREKRDAVKESGPFRLEVAKVEKVTPTPAEVAEGYDTKFLVTFAFRGKGSSELYPIPSSANEHLSVLETSVIERNGKKWRAIPANVFPSVRTKGYEGYYISPDIGKMQAAVLVPLWKLPNKDLQVRLSLGEAMFFPTTSMIAPTLSVPIRNAGEAAPNPQVSHTCSLSLHRMKVNLSTPVSDYEDGGIPSAYRLIKFEVKTQTSRWKNPYLNWKMFNACLVDGNGKIYRKWLDWDLDNPVPKSRFRDFINYPIQSTGKPDVYSFQYFFSTASIPASTGKLTFKAQVSENGEWPLPLSIVVREKDDWTLKRSRTLKLKSIETQPSSDDPTRLDVIVKTNYVGKQKLVATSQGSLYFYGYRDMYEINDFVPKKYQLERKPSERFLVTNWSQRIESSLTSLPSPAFQKVNSGYYPVRVHSISSTANEWTIIYRITLIRLKTLPKPLSFKADIGVEGDGLLPVSIALPISKKP